MRPAVLAVLAAAAVVTLPLPAAGSSRVIATLPAGARVDYQLGGPYRPAAGVRVVERDRTARPDAGAYNICYVNGFQTQPDELSWWRARHRSLLLHTRAGREVVDADWGETLLDTSTAAKRSRLAAIATHWIDGCAHAGYAAVEFDNLDSWTRSAGLLSRADNAAYAALLTAAAHRAGLAAGQKNTPELASRRHRLGFDFAVAEECQVYDECGAYAAAFGREWFEVEYTDNGGAAFRRACAARGGRVSVLLADRDLLPSGTRGHVRRWCR